jgi:hypothetical protein
MSIRSATRAFMLIATERYCDVSCVEEDRAETTTSHNDSLHIFTLTLTHSAGANWTPTVEKMYRSRIQVLVPDQETKTYLREHTVRI